MHIHIYISIYKTLSVSSPPVFGHSSGAETLKGAPLSLAWRQWGRSALTDLRCSLRKCLVANARRLGEAGRREASCHKAE